MRDGDATGAIDPHVMLARRMRLGRVRRGRHLPSVLLGEPGWDILLDLLVSGADGVDVPMHVAWLASGVPPSTAARYVLQLEKEGMVRQMRDPRDRRRKMLVLTTDGDRRLRASLEEMLLALGS